ncbi:hypothetical protein Hamer_G007167 [Homarus americanus]|uniref:Uncharacterized protein n=1 Tax=Homarus americanus TaxID=6706 RepID=A0A8J5MVW9_HOMAM|nr:hypothetical protein Hamer_G007167 [Homarus americanus]
MADLGLVQGRRRIKHRGNIGHSRGHGLQNQPPEVLRLTNTTTGVARDGVGYLHSFPPPIHRQRTMDTLVPQCRPASLATTAPTLFVASDTSDVGWRAAHINVQELYVVWRFLEVNQTTQDEAICFEMDSAAGVFCLNRQGTSRSAQLLSLSEQIFKEAHHRSIHLSARHVLGIENGWADALSRFKDKSVEWTLRQSVFQSLMEWWGLLEVDLFASPTSAQLPVYLSWLMPTPHGGPGAFTEDWNRWTSIYLFPPPCCKVLLPVCHKFCSFKGKVLLLAPYWPAQPWFS